MARNLVAEKDQPTSDKQISPQLPKLQEEEVKVITENALTQYKLDSITKQLEKLEALIREMARQVGVKFE